MSSLFVSLFWIGDFSFLFPCILHKLRPNPPTAGIWLATWTHVGDWVEKEIPSCTDFGQQPYSSILWWVIRVPNSLTTSETSWGWDSMQPAPLFPLSVFPSQWKDNLDRLGAYFRTYIFVKSPWVPFTLSGIYVLVSNERG